MAEIVAVAAPQFVPNVPLTKARPNGETVPVPKPLQALLPSAARVQLPVPVKFTVKGMPACPDKTCVKQTNTRQNSSIRGTITPPSRPVAGRKCAGMVKYTPG